MKFFPFRLHSDGYNEGFFKGQLIGQVEGFTLGVERGKAFGQEVFFIWFYGILASCKIQKERQH